MQEILLTLSPQASFGLSINDIDNVPTRIYAGSRRELSEYNSFSVTYMLRDEIGIGLCSHPSLISAYDSNIETIYPELQNFIIENIEALSEISPCMTYVHTIAGAKEVIANWDKEKALAFIRYISMIYARYYIGNFLESRMLTGTIWEERYQAILNDKVDSKEFSKFLDEIDNKKYESYYCTLNPNYELYEQYKVILNNALKKVRSIYGDEDALYL